MFSESFLSEIKSLALQIAKRQRGENHMQDIPTLLFVHNLHKLSLWRRIALWY